MWLKPNKIMSSGAYDLLPLFNILLELPLSFPEIFKLTITFGEIFGIFVWLTIFYGFFVL
jgi:hypothetical protein